MNFKKIQLEDKAVLSPFYDINIYRNCELTFGNTLLWSQFYGIEYTIIDGCLVFKTTSKNPQFIYPIGEGDKKVIINKIIEYCNENRIKFCMRSVNEDMFQELNEMMPDTFYIEYNRDMADYIYLSEDLMKLSGKKYHGKKNHVNKFIASYQWSYERIDATNKEECIVMAKEWSEIHQTSEDDGKAMEMKVTMDAINYLEDLNLSGGLLRVDGKVVAISIGEPVGQDCFVIHVEKAFSDIQGAYPMINQQMILDYGKDYQYINREEDMGIEGLRKAKLSYKPTIILEKGIVRIKNHESDS